MFSSHLFSLPIFLIHYCFHKYILAEKSTGNFMGVPWNVIWCFFLAVFKIFVVAVVVVFNFCHFDYYMSLLVPPWVYPAWNSVLPGIE